MQNNKKEGTYISELNYITEMLELKDNNIKFYENCYHKEKIKGVCHNGYIEGNNNFIKVLKRIAFGFRSFRRFKARIMICKGLVKINRKKTSAFALTSQD